MTTRKLVWLGVILGALALVLVVQPWDVLAAVFSLGVLAQALKTAIPYVLAALGGAITERSGVVDLALEAKLLFGALVAIIVTLAFGSPYLGILGGMLAGMATAWVQLFFALRLGADQVIVGVALNLLALGGTRFVLQLVYGEGSNSPVSQAKLPSNLVANPIFWLAVLATIAVPIALARTRWGLRLRAAGDRPDALVSVGASPERARMWAGLVGGALAGAGGAHLSLTLGSFVADMAGGRGYMALAMVILAGWRPAWAALACFGVAFAIAANVQLQLVGTAIPRQLAPLLPYVLTLGILVIAGSKRRPPRSLGKL